MLAKDKTENVILLPPSWKGVRTIYKNLSDEFHVLTDSFNVKIDLQTKIHLDHLIIAIDEVDNCIDELPTKAQRDSITKSLTDFLANDKELWYHPNATETLSLKIQNIKLIVRKEQIGDEFIDASKTIFHNTEIKRHTKNPDELIQFIIREGGATARLPLCFLGIKPDIPFGKFFTDLCMLMGIADLIFDANQDFQKGFISLKPSFKLYVKLFYILIVDGTKLLLSIPRKLKFINYCLRFTLIMIKE